MQPSDRPELGSGDTNPCLERTPHTAGTSHPEPSTLVYRPLLGKPLPVVEKIVMPIRVTPDRENLLCERVAGTGKGRTARQVQFGDRVRQFRHELGVSQEELAHRAAINRTYVAS